MTCAVLWFFAGCFSRQKSNLFGRNHNLAVQVVFQRKCFVPQGMKLCVQVRRIQSNLTNAEPVAVRLVVHRYSGRRKRQRKGGFHIPEEP